MSSSFQSQRTDELLSSFVLEGLLLKFSDHFYAPRDGIPGWRMNPRSSEWRENPDTIVGNKQVRVG